MKRKKIKVNVFKASTKERKEILRADLNKHLEQGYKIEEEGTKEVKAKVKQIKSKANDTKKGDTDKEV